MSLNEGNKRWSASWKSSEDAGAHRHSPLRWRRLRRLTTFFHVPTGDSHLRPLKS